MALINTKYNNNTIIAKKPRAHLHIHLHYTYIYIILHDTSLQQAY